MRAPNTKRCLRSKLYQKSREFLRTLDINNWFLFLLQFQLWTIMKTKTNWVLFSFICIKWARSQGAIGDKKERPSLTYKSAVRSLCKWALWKVGGTWRSHLDDDEMFHPPLNSKQFIYSKTFRKSHKKFDQVRFSPHATHVWTSCTTWKHRVAAGVVQSAEPVSHHTLTFSSITCFHVFTLSFKFKGMSCFQKVKLFSSYTIFHNIINKAAVLSSSSSRQDQLPMRRLRSL